jgi:GNAT superfamily N-acetyltransferase
VSDARLPHELRPFRESDRNFIVRGWASEMRRSAFSRHVPPEVYWPCQHELVAQLLKLGTTIVACDPDNEEHVYGAVVYQPADLAIVHWCYVKGDYRRVGLASALLVAAIGDRRPVYCTQPSVLFGEARELVAKHELIACPYLLLGIAPPARERSL